MKTRKKDNLKALVLLLLLIPVIRLIPGCPWWGFTIPVIITGGMSRSKGWNVSSFWIGFLAGFLVWTSATFYFDVSQPGDILQSIGRLLSLPKIMIITISGIIGGGVTGIAFYSGKSAITANVNKSSL